MDVDAALRSRFTEEEWAKLSTAPMTIAALIIQADPGGVFKEVTGLLRFLEETRQAGQPDLLCDAILAEQTEALEDLRTGVHALKLAKHSTDPYAPVNEVLDILSAKCELQDSLAVRQMLYQVAQRVAEAGKEGGFLGFGGVPVSDKEQAVLTRLRFLMRL